VPYGEGVLVIDDCGDRKDGTATACAGHRWLGRYGKTDNGVVTVTTLWADERIYHPLHAVPYPRRAGCPAAKTIRPFAPDRRSPRSAAERRSRP
jgi:SRSO17 transposase